MKKHNIISRRTFTLGINQDVNIDMLPPDQYFNANDIEKGYGLDFNEVRPGRGLTLIDHNEYTGANFQTIGFVEDKVNNRLVYFVAALDRSTYYIMLLDGTTHTLLLDDPVLNLLPVNKVHSGVIIDGILYWTDGSDTGFGPQGNPPRMLNIDRHVSGKEIKYELLFNSDCFTISTEFSYTLRQLDGTLISGPTLVYTTVGTAVDGIMLGLSNAMDAAGFDVVPFPVNTATNPAKKLEFNWNADDVRVEMTVVNAGAPNPEVQTNELNFYPTPTSTPDLGIFLRMIQPCPLIEPLVQYEYDSSLVGLTNIKGLAFQFRIRYVYVDGEKSAWGPASQVPTNFKPNGLGPVQPSTTDQKTNEDLYNVIRIDLNEERFLLNGWRTYLREVELCYRNYFGDVWRFVDSYDLSEFRLDDFTIVFTNNSLAGAVASDEDADPNIQALKNFDQVPKIALGLEAIYDDGGNALLALGGGLYDYDLPVVEANLGIQDTVIPASDYAASDQVSVNKGLKSGGSYRVGIIYKDGYSRLSSVVPLGSVNVPFGVTPVGSLPPSIVTKTLTVEIVTPPPFWATHWQVCLTLNEKQLTYSMVHTGEVNRYRYQPGRGDIVVDATGEYIGFHLHLGELGSNIDNTRNAFLFEFTELSGINFLLEEGVRLVVRGWFNGTPSGTNPPVAVNIESYDYPIEGYAFVPLGTGSNERDEFVLLISANGRPEFETTPGATFKYIIEIYNPKTGINTDIYYEFGPIKKIIGSHGAISLEQYGDTYVTYRDYLSPPDLPDSTSTQPLHVWERPFLHASDHSADKPNPDHGRAVAFDPLYKERYLSSTIRHSDIYIPQSSIRGLSSFRGASIFRINPEYGILRKLVLNQTVLLAIATSKTQPIYIAKDRLLALSGESMVGRTDRIFNIADEVQLDLGTKHPGSVFYEDGHTYGLDSRQGVIWRYSTGGGQLRISDYGLIDNTKIALLILDNNLQQGNVVTVMERRTQKFIFAYGPISTFKEIENPHWEAFLSFDPEYMATYGQDVYFFNEGKPWVMDNVAPRANYFGVQQTPNISLVFNDSPEIIKHWDSLDIFTNTRWNALLISIDSNDTYPNGMLSQLIDNKFNSVEGVLRADFLRDQTDPVFLEIVDPVERTVTALLKGRYLRSRSILITIQHSDPGQDSKLTQVLVYWQPSKQTAIP